MVAQAYTPTQKRDNKKKGLVILIVNFALRISLAVLLLMISSAVLCAAPVAGSFISNQAQSSYIDSSSGLHSNLSSNTVRARVLPLQGIQLDRNQTQGVSPGGTVYLSHTLTNTGNSSANYLLSALNLLNDAYDLNNLRIIHDTNGNGVADAGETVLTPATPLPLAAGASTSLLLTGSVPATVAFDVYAYVQLTARIAGTTRSAVNTDGVVSRNGAIIAISKSVDIPNAMRNDVLTYTLNARNTGVSAAIGRSISIDGYTLQRVIIHDVIPANTTFAAFRNTGGGQALYHRFGDPLHTYLSTPPASLAQIDAVAVAFSRFPANSALTMQFAVTVNQNASGPVNNSGAVYFHDALNPALTQSPSNTVQTNVSLLPPTMDYYTNNLYQVVTPATILGNPLYLQASAASCNVDPQRAETRTVIISSALTGDSEQYVLVETGPNTGVFRLQTAVGIPTQDARLVAVVINNGTIETLTNDALTASMPGCGTASVTTQILVDPVGCTFDSQTGAGLAGSTVTLIDVTGQGNGGNAGGAATVFAADGITPLSATQVTDSYGCYQFPTVPPSTYRIQVQPPGGYLFPSATPVAQLPAGYTVTGDPVNGGASYGGNFIVSAATGAVTVNFPLDSYTAAVAASGSVNVYKQVSTTNAAPGATLSYTLTATNPGLGNAPPVPLLVDGVTASMVLVRDIIPANTTFSGITSAAASTVLYHISGVPQDQYTTVPPATLNNVDAVAFAYTTFPPGSHEVLGFNVIINGNATGNINNTAVALYRDVYANTVYNASNSTAVATVLTAPIIDYYTDTSYSRIAPAIGIGYPLYVQASASSCNVNPLLAEQRPVTITSALTGDTETLMFQETGPNTGIFQMATSPYNLPTRDGSLFPATLNNGIMEVLNQDTLTATITSCGTAITARTNILVDPGGTVFDSNTGQPIPGVSVTLIDNATGLPATVLQFNGVTPAPNTVITDAYGFFQFPLVAPGNYHLQIAAVPNGYTYPSTVPLAQLPPQYTILGNPNAVATSGSYGGTFSVTPAAGPVVLDVPMDPIPAIGLVVSKVASTDTVELGGYVDYTVSIRSTLTVDINQVVMHDVLPHGFVYIHGSGTRDGTAIADPAGAPGPQLNFNIGVLRAGATTTFRYRARVGVGSLQGDGNNIAWAQSPVLRSNTAMAKVKVTAGMLGDQAYLFGKVYMDCDGNRMQGKEEIGIPGVRLYLEDGTFAITDVEGKWSLYGLKPRTHVVKVDRITLPKGAQMSNLSNRHGGVGDSRFVDLKKGDWHRADFALNNCTESIRAEVYERRDQGSVQVSELQRSINATGVAAGLKALPYGQRSPVASGMLTPQQPLPGFEQPDVPGGLNSKNSHLPVAPVGEVMQAEIEQRMHLMNNHFGFVDLHDGDTLPYTQSNVLIKGELRSTFKLWVNGDLISGKKIGMRSSLQARGLELWQYIGLSLKPGKNTLRAAVYDPFGNKRGEKTIHLIAPGELAQLKLTIPDSADADGHSPVTVAVELADAHGVPVTVRTPLTLETSLGRWKAKDVNPQEQGVQVFMEGGRQEFLLYPPQQPGEATIRISSGIIEKIVQLDFLPPLRPMIAVGVLEGRIQVNSFNLKNIQPVRQRDSFEQQLRLFARSNGKREAAARAAVFLKGRVLGSYLLTAAYDSDKTTKARLLRDIQPGSYYPIYGDSALKGFDAQSTTRLYVRLDHDRSWMLYGDFTTQADAQDPRKLSLYNRTLSGVQQHYENTLVSVDGFATHDVSRQVVDEIAANGTSGPYYLNNTTMLVNSEKVEVLVRDRNQPSLILKTTPMQRFADYAIDALTGRLIMNAPVASLDANLNPQSIRITYEVTQGTQAFWTGGINGQLHLGSHVTVGASHVRDRNPLNPTRLSGTYAQFRLGDKFSAIVEGARSHTLGKGKGNARRAEIQFKQGKTQGRVYLGRADVTFVNPSAALNAGREERGAELNTQLGKTTQLKARALLSKNKSNGSQRRGADIAINQSLGHYLHAEAAYRHSRDSSGAASTTGAIAGPNRLDSGRLKLSSQIPGMEALGVYGEYERDLRDARKRRMAIGADYQFANQGKLYMRHEFLNSNSGAFGLNPAQGNASTVIGIDTNYMKDGHLFSEYRARDAISGREDQAAIGLRNGWQLDEGLRLNTNIERIRVLNGPGTANSTTLGTGLEYTANPLWKASGSLEFHFGTAENSMLSKLAMSRKLDMDWSLLGKNTWSRRLNRGTSHMLTDNLFQLGIAYRETMRNHVDWLLMYQWQLKADTGLASDTRSHLLSTHINVQPVRPLTLSGRYAIRWSRESIGGMASAYGIQALSGRAMWDITERWDGGLIASTMFSNGFGTRHQGIGIESGYQLYANLWLSAGYNIFGFRDRAGLTDQYTDRGAFLRFRFKFDETLFDREQ